MSFHLRGLSAVGIVSILLAAPALAQEDTVANPYYKFWAGAKLGSTAVHREQTKLSGTDGKLIPDGIDSKRIAYKLVEINENRAIVEMVVTEQDFLGYVQSAPTRYIYPAKIKKSHLERVLLADGGKTGEETLKVDGKDIKCRTLSGAVKGPDGEQVEFKLWLSDDVTGTIVKQVRTARQKEDVVAVTTTTLRSFTKAE
jgi:hypothetical protein